MERQYCRDRPESGVWSMPNQFGCTREAHELLYGVINGLIKVRFFQVQDARLVGKIFHDYYK